MRSPVRLVLLLVVWLALAAGCTRMPVTEKTPIAPKSTADLQKYLLSHRPDVDLFRLRGPFAVEERKNHVLPLSKTERINADLFLAAPPEKAPLVIFMHGYDATKEAHEFQAEHVAAWGMHALTLQLSRKGPWAGNGRTLARIVELIRRSPETIDPRIDPDRIILVGHSFGAVSVVVALGSGAPAAGAILLDPAAIGKDLPKILQQIKKPVLVLGADEEASPTRNRHWFYRFVRGGVAEVSVRDAEHEDAQYPSQTSLDNFGIDPSTTETLQVTFVSALTAAALSLSFTGSFDYAWTSFATALADGRFLNPKKK